MMYKIYSDSYLMTKSKKTLIEYLRVAEHNHKVCEEQIEQQYKNCMELLNKERADTIDECIGKITNEHTHSCYNDDVYECVKLLEQLKEK